MKKIATILGIILSTSAVFAQVSDLQRPGDLASKLAEARRGRDTKIQDLDSAIADIQNVMNLGQIQNPEVRRMLRTAIFKIEDVQIKIYQEQHPGPGHGNIGQKTVVVSLVSSNSRLFIGKSQSRIQSIQLAQAQCLKVETYASGCKTDAEKLKTEEIFPNNDTMNVVSLESSNSRLFIAESNSVLEATQLAQAKCHKVETYASGCTASPEKLKSEAYSIRNIQGIVRTCSLKSSNSRLYIGQGKTKVEAVALAQEKCNKIETYTSGCKASLDKVVCE